VQPEILFMGKQRPNTFLTAANATRWRQIPY
jgi:hypothetical protein